MMIESCLPIVDRGQRPGPEGPYFGILFQGAEAPCSLRKNEYYCFSGLKPSAPSAKAKYNCCRDLKPSAPSVDAKYNCSISTGTGTGLRRCLSMNVGGAMWQTDSVDGIEDDEIAGVANVDSTKEGGRQEASGIV